MSNQAYDYFIPSFQTTLFILINSCLSFVCHLVSSSGDGNERVFLASINLDKPDITRYAAKPNPTTDREREKSTHALSNETRARLNARSKEGESDGTAMLRAWSSLMFPSSVCGGTIGGIRFCKILTAQTH